MHKSGRQILRSRFLVLLPLALVLGLISVTAARGDAGTQAGPNNGGREGSGFLSEAGPRTVILENGSAGARPGAPLAPICSTPNVAIPDNDANGVSDSLMVAENGALVEGCLVPESIGGGINLAVDDGTAENAIGLTAGGQLVWLNRFTPNPAAFPFTLTGIQVLFRSGDGIVTGDTFDLYVYTDADGDPANGATHVASSTNKSVQLLDGFFTYPVNIPLAGPGDVLIAVVNRTAGTDPGEYPAAIDQTASQGRSWIGFYDGNPADPPVLPATTFGVIDDFGFPGNWMIRGVGVETGHAYLPIVVGAATTGQPAGSEATAPIAPAAALLAPFAILFIARHTRRLS